MPDMISEAIVVLLDASRSMFRADYSPNRLDASKQAILDFIEARTNSDKENGSASAFGLVVIRSSAEKIFDMADAAQYGNFEEYFTNLACGGTTALGDGLGLAIKILIEDIRTNGARIPRILLISDGTITHTNIDPNKMGSLAKQLGMRVDCMLLGEMQAYNVLRQISETTNGKFTHTNNLDAMQRFARDLAVSNFLPPGSKADGSKNRIPQAILKKIASPLLTESEMSIGSQDQKEIIARLRGTKSYEKCSICFQANDPISKTEFNISEGMCSNCGTPMHYSCASQWAKNQNKGGDGTIFRCVHCLYLLKIPASVQTAVQMAQNLKKEIRAENIQNLDSKTVNVQPVLAGTLGETALYSACPVCSGIFEDDEHVIKCGNRMCNAIYHMHCFDKLDDHQCKVCGYKLVQMF
ncbi:MAG: VWA domain-containing protein [Promethearchaeota archaeon]|nr:MAG: VWA domain-containing protein [Candidatus Lokiarchaeota archaeon]